MRLGDYGSVTYAAGYNNQVFVQQESGTYTPPTPQTSGHRVVDVGDNEYAVNRKTNSIDADQLDRDAVKQKLAYITAQANGDKQGMARAAAQANEDYKAGATLKSGEDTAATKALKNYYEQSGIKVAITSHSVEDLNKGILQAKNDYAWAKAHNDQAGMTAAAQLATNLRALGGTIGAGVSLDDAKKAVYGTPTTPKATSQSNSLENKVKQAGASVASFLGGVAYSVINNTSLGALHQAANDDSLTNNKVYDAGKATGDLVSTGIGVYNVIQGVGNAIAGTLGAAATAETGVGILVGGTVAVAGAAQATGGAFVAGTSLSNLKTDTMNLFKSNGDGAGSDSLKSNLDDSESAGGHTIDRHVGKTDQQLLDRLQNDTNIGGSSSFTDKSTAQKVVDSTIESNQGKVEDFMNTSKPGQKIVLSYDGDGSVIGRVAKPGSNQVQDATKAIVVVKKTSQNGFVLTAYPTK